MPLQFHGKYLLTSPTYEDTITCVAFSVHGDYIAVGGLNQSPIKSLIWLPGAEQTLVCACHSGILMNIIVHPGDTMNFNCFRTQHHTVEFMAADASTSYLATGSGLDVRVWKGDKRHDWKGHRILGPPKKSADNCDAAVILTGLHWHGTGTDTKLITTYRHHGIQLWDVEKMSVVQSINMPSPMLGSSLSPNKLHISTAKRGGYDVYSLNTGIVLQTFVHGLPPNIDTFPSTFLPRGFAFCGATVDGAVTLWDVKLGDPLQSVRHLSGATLHAIAVHATEKSGIMLLATASHNEVRIWHTISSGITSHSIYDHQHFAKPDATVVAWAVIICTTAVLLAWVFQTVA